MQTLGRFELVRLLGEGAQARVWLARDPRLQREVAIKLLHAGHAGAADAWLHEARAVGRLKHPNIVPLFEADRFDGQAALVFEYVPGRTLQHWLGGSKLAARQAVALAVQVLDALAAAHAAGVVHRDLKPSAVIVDDTMRAHVGDFGVAALGEAAAARIAGTPGYLAPEAARGEPPQPQMDVFSAAVVLAELLLGQPLPLAADPLQAVREAAQRQIDLPPLADADVDDALRAIVQRGLATDPVRRWESAAAMRDALSRWLGQEGHGETPAAVAGSAAVEFLLRRMRSQGDFPALTAAIERVHQLARSDSESLGSVANQILHDVALTQKLLKLVNSAAFHHAGGGSISTVSRAVALVGLGGVRNLALSLVLLERMRDRGHAAQLKVEFLRGLMAASLARELADAASEGEELFLAALFQNLGRLLAEFYFPEEARQVRRLVREGSGTQAAISEATAAVRVLGLGYEELGIAVARHWGLPEELTQAMQRPADEPPARALASRVERQRWVARAANEAADTLLASEPAAAPARLRSLGERYAKALVRTPEHWAEACDQARQRLAGLAEAMELQVERQSPARRLLLPADATAPDELAGVALHATLTDVPADAHDRVAQGLAAGIQDISDAMLEASDAGAVLRMLVETLLRAFDAQRVLLALRDARGEQLQGRFGLGDGVEALLPLLRVPLRLAAGQAPDLFSAVALKGADTLIADASQPNIAQRLPTAWRQPARAGSLLLLPLRLKEQTLGLLYVDSARPGALAVSDKELALLRALRNQALIALRQGGA